jgi:hypothetical protein
MRKQTNYKLPEELIALLQERASAEKVSATELVITALKNLLGIDQGEEDTYIPNSILELVRDIEILKERLDKIEFSRQFNFLSNSPYGEATGIDIRIDSSNTDSNSETKITALTTKIKELGDENKSLRERVRALEALIPEYNCQEFVPDSKS